MRLYTTINPFDEMARLQHQVNRVFSEMTGEGETANWSIAVELEERAEDFVLRALLPGVDRDTVNVEATRDGVAISGEYPSRKPPEGDRRFYSEFPTGKFRRTVSLPLPIANDAVKAHYEDGVLVLTLPKAPEAINRVVKVSLSNGSEAAQIEAAAE